MPANQKKQDSPADLFTRAAWYDQSINWKARLAREIPVLQEVLGEAGSGGIVDAGCGPAYQARALAEAGYHVVGVDLSPTMIELARAKDSGLDNPRYVECSYDVMHEKIGGGFDGIYCQGNALAASGSLAALDSAIEQFSKCLRPSGRLFLQVLNFPPMRNEVPCVRGPRLVVVDGQEFISVRQFHFAADNATVTNITLWQDDGWHQRSHGGQLYPVTLDELRSMMATHGLPIDNVWGSYDKEPFDSEKSVDLIITATRA